MEVALTFDDGPNPPYTNQILDILKKEGIKATFFVCGANVKRHPEVLKRIAKDGHLIGNHTYYHRYFPTLLGLTYKEIIETQKLIEELTPQREKYYKAPWCNLPFWLKNKLENAGFSRVHCGVMGNDWQKTITPDQIAEKVLKNINSSTVITLHDGEDTKENADRSKTVEALPKIINGLKKQDYQFVSPLDLD